MNHRISMWRSLGLAAFTPALALAAAACSWQVPADPGLNYAQRTRPPEVARGLTAPPTKQEVARAGEDPQARALYLNHCSRCHAPFDPRAIPAGQWPMYVAKYGPRAGLFGADRARVLAWLQANAQ